MQLRSALSLLVLTLLYWAALPLATRVALAQDEPSASGQARATTQPHVAVLLPLQSNSFGKHADSVRLGVFAAASLDQGSLPVIVYSTPEDPYRVLEAYERAVSTGAVAVIGPLTRSGVSALASSGAISIPTLALNAPDMELRPSPQLYLFGLQIEAEARQVANHARKQGGKSAFVIVGETALGRRIAQAFSAQWLSRKGQIAEQFVYSTEVATLTKLRERLAATSADTIFLSVDEPRARFLRPHLGSKQSIYATSLVFSSSSETSKTFDLEGIRFLDMPWLLQPDHPAVMSYLRADVAGAPLDQERFYALGIDSYRIVHALLDNPAWRGPLDGVTGTIRIDANQQILRVPMPAQFLGGAPRPSLATP
jgi:uncharacterized protein